MIQRSTFVVACLAALAAPTLAQTELYRIDGAMPGDELGFSVAVLGDIDGDGADDYIVGAPRSDVGGTDAGTAYVVSGLSGTTLHTLHGSRPGDRFGYSVAGPGDLDGDTVPDWIVGAPQVWYEPGAVAGGLLWGGNVGKGYAVAYSGKTGTELYTVAPSSGYAYGLSLGTGGDVDQDTVPDFILGGDTARIHSGATGALFREHSLPGETHSSVIVNDLSGTGKDDYVVGSFIDSGNFNGALRAYRGPTGALMWTDWPNALLAEYGFSCAAPGDLDGDGRPDVVGGGLDDGGWLVYGWGRVRALAGSDASLFYETTGEIFTARGYALAGVGDFDGDGVPEFAASAPGIEGGCNGRRVQLLSGASYKIVMKIPQDDDCDRFGSALAAGDVNGDGLTELLIGARWDDDGGAQAGSLKVFSLQGGPTVYCQAQKNSQNCTPAISWTGQPSLSVNNFHVQATNIVSQKSGLLFWGLASKQSPFKGGLKCVAPPTVRTPVQNSGGTLNPPDCSGAFLQQLTAGYLTSKGLGAGDTVYCQYWSRDPLNAFTTNLTDALAFTLEP